MKKKKKQKTQRGMAVFYTFLFIISGAHFSHGYRLPFSPPPRQLYGRV